ncbi:MAG: radical SAM protein [Deltaproteobacteria bacterium]|nr:radical SAM protein [Deltaproteobacteria bacterium]
MDTETVNQSAVPARFYPQAIVNITNRCNLHCSHCFVYRDGNPNQPVSEPSDDDLLAQIREIRDRHRIGAMLWMGGEPLIKKDLLRRGLPLFARNTITTNGTIPLADFSDVTENLLYVISLDGPEALNDSIRGEGVFRRVMDNMGRLPSGFPHVVQCQCVVTRRNQDSLPEFVEIISRSPFRHLTFSFHVPARNDTTGNAWESVRQRDDAIRLVMELKKQMGGLIRNRTRSLEMMLSENNPGKITGNCPAKQLILPLYLSGRTLVSPFCCYGNDVDCDRCGAWVVFEMAAALENPAVAARQLHLPD